MVEQLSFFDGDGARSADPLPGKGERREARPPSFTLFFALVPAPEMAFAIARHAIDWDRQHRMGGRVLKPDLLHVSLHALGAYNEEVPAEAVQFARRIGAAVSAQTFEVVLDRAMSFRSPKSPYVLCVGEGLEQIKAFRQAVGIVIAEAGGPSKATPFTPHMTLSYGGSPVVAHGVEPIRWRVKDLVLLNSHYGKSYHEELGRWPLHD